MTGRKHFSIGSELMERRLRSSGTRSPSFMRVEKKSTRPSSPLTIQAVGRLGAVSLEQSSSWSWSRSLFQHGMLVSRERGQERNLTISFFSFRMARSPCAIRSPILFANRLT